MQLITEEAAPRLKAAYEASAKTGESSQAVIAKFFTPWAGATWYITEGMPVDENGEPTSIENARDWHLFGFCNLGDREAAELGYVMLSDLESVRGPAGLRVERDLHYGEHTLDEVMK